MTHRETLKDIYTDEMKDLWSANDQMMKAVKTMSAKAHDADLKDALEQSIKGIANHADTLEFLISEAGAHRRMIPKRDNVLSTRFDHAPCIFLHLFKFLTSHFRCGTTTWRDGARNTLLDTLQRR